MKNINIKLLLVLLTGCMLGACKKELNVFPTTSEVDGNVIIDQSSAQVVLNGVYYAFADGGKDASSVPTIYWTNPNEIFPSELTNAAVNSSGDDKIYSFGFNATTAFVVGNTPVDVQWKYDYALVNAANGFIKNATPVTNISTAAKTQMLAEAKFLRAYGDSQLLLYYGQYNDPTSKYGIILRDTFISTQNVNYPRSSVATTYTSILTDLNDAIAGLPTLNSAIYYANASDAKLLKARVLMNRGASGDYAQVISLTNDIITNGPFALQDSLKNIFLSKGFTSKEVMLAVQPYPTQNYKYEEDMFLTQYQATDSLVNLLKYDSRNQWVYKKINSLLFGPLNAISKYYSGSATSITQTPMLENCYAFRLSEAYLLEAEAITLSGGNLATAKTLLTTVMSHAGAGAQEFAAVANANTAAALQLQIVKENLRNFVFENGVDWFALRRLGVSGSTLNLQAIEAINPFIKDVTRLILPIPYSETVVNPVLQNPGY